MKIYFIYFLILFGAAMSKPSIIDIWQKGIQRPAYTNLYQYFSDGFALNPENRLKEFDITIVPWYRVLCEWFHDSSVEVIYLIQGSQTGKTTFMIGCFNYCAQYMGAGVPILWAMSQEDECNSFIENRLKGVMSANASKDAMKNWKRKSFKVLNAKVKIGWGSSEKTLESDNIQFSFNDECAKWVVEPSFTRKRMRTYHGKSKGFYCTTPPKDGTHPSWREATANNFYQWWVPCPDCGYFQYMIFGNLVIPERKKNGKRDYQDVLENTQYKCPNCDNLWNHDEKILIMNQGKAVCVDPVEQTEVKPDSTDGNTLQVSGLYSAFEPWGKIAWSFLKAKHIGNAALKTFFTHELAEVPRMIDESIKSDNLKKYINTIRKIKKPIKAQLYTAGIDAQRDVLYYSVWAWRAGFRPSGHLIDYGKVKWREGKKIDWLPLLQALKPYKHLLKRAFIDSSDGTVTTDIYDFCNFYRGQFRPIKDKPMGLAKVEQKVVKDDSKSRKRGTVGQAYYLVDSQQIKDDIADAFARETTDPNVWTFPSETSAEFLRQMSNEHKIVVRVRGKDVKKWLPRYAKADQHYFSTCVYATAAMEVDRKKLQNFSKVEQEGQLDILSRKQGKRRKHSALVELI